MVLIIPASAHYRPADVGDAAKCQTCAYFYGPRWVGWCGMYQAPVGGIDVCDNWKAKR